MLCVSLNAKMSVTYGLHTSRTRVDYWKHVVICEKWIAQFFSTYYSYHRRVTICFVAWNLFKSPVRRLLISCRDVLGSQDLASKFAMALNFGSHKYHWRQASYTSQGVEACHWKDIFLDVEKSVDSEYDIVFSVSDVFAEIKACFTSVIQYMQYTNL